MNTTEKTNGSHRLALAYPAIRIGVSHSAASDGNQDEPSLIPGEFLGPYRAGYQAGFISGQEAGFKEGYVAAHQGPTNGAAVTSAAETKTAPKGGPRRMLLGMPCPKCRIYLHSEETRCPSCGQAVSVA
jgi:hypothetical protein